jgi:FkbM family methyltransferase
MPSTRSTESGFSAALAAQRSGLLGEELQKTYPSESRVARRPTFWGDEMEIVLPELVSCELDRYGLIEAGVTRLFLDLVGPAMVVLDVGAHLGYYSLLAAHLGARVHSFEPSSATIPRLRRNLDGRATLVPCGVWSEKGKLEYRDFGEEHSAVGSFFAPKDGSLGAPVATEVVQVVSIDSYLDDEGIVPDLIKIDAEGAEEHVLRGAQDTIAKHHPVVTIEVGDAPGTPRSRNAVELGLSYGYEMFELTPAGRTKHVPRDEYGYGNLALIPPT